MPARRAGRGPAAARDGLGPQVDQRRPAARLPPRRPPALSAAPRDPARDLPGPRQPTVRTSARRGSPGTAPAAASALDRPAGVAAVRRRHGLTAAAEVRPVAQGRVGQRRRRTSAQSGPDPSDAAGRLPTRSPRRLRSAGPRLRRQGMAVAAQPDRRATGDAPPTGSSTWRHPAHARVRPARSRMGRDGSSRARDAGEVGSAAAPASATGCGTNSSPCRRGAACSRPL